MSVGPSVRWSVGPLVCRSIGKAKLFWLSKAVFALLLLASCLNAWFAFFHYRPCPCARDLCSHLIGLVVGELSSFCLLFLAVNHSKAGNKLGLGVGLVLGLGIRSGIVLGIGLGLGLGLVLGLGVF